MRKGYSLVKRGNVYFVYHRKTPDGKQIGVSLKTGEQREADRRAKIVVAKAESDLALARVQADEAERNRELRRQYDAMSDEERSQYIKEFIDAMDDRADAFRQQHMDEIERRRAEEEAERAHIQAQKSQAELDLVNPQTDAFWFLAEKKEGDSGKYVEWCRAGHRSPNTLIAYRTAWNRFREYFMIERLGDITPKMAKDFEKKLLSDTTKRGRRGLLGKSGAMQYMVCMQGMISTAIKEGWLDGENPFRIEYQHKRDRIVGYLTPTQITALLNEAKTLDDKTVYLFVAIAVHTGMRKDEVANLMWADIDFDNKVVKVQAKTADGKDIQEFRPKSKQARTIPLKKELAKILKSVRRDSGYVIQPDSKVKRARWTVPKEFGAVQKSAGVTCNPHLFRHTFASWAAAKGVSIYKIQTWLGHSTVQLTADTYAHLQAHDKDIDRF